MSVLNLSMIEKFTRKLQKITKMAQFSSSKYNQEEKQYSEVEFERNQESKEAICMQNELQSSRKNQLMNLVKSKINDLKHKKKRQTSQPTKVQLKCVPKKQKFDSQDEQSQQINIKDEDIKEQHEESEKRRSIVSSILEETHNMSKEQKNKYLKNIAMTQLLISTHELRIWVDAYQIIFNVERQLQAHTQNPDQKTISKKLAKHFMKHVKNNQDCRRYKFRRICSYALTELNFKTVKVDQWLNKFINQNKSALPLIHLEEYPLKDSAEIKQENYITAPVSINSKQQQKQKQVKIVSNVHTQKNNEISKQKYKRKSHSRSNKNSSMVITELLDSEDQKLKQKSFEIQINQVVEVDQITNSKNSMRQKLKNLKQVGKKSKTSKQILNPTTKNEVLKQKRQEKKQQNIIGEKPELQIIKVKADLQVLQNENKTKNISQIKPFFSYPQQFQKKVAARLDNTFERVFQEIIKSKCEEYCVQEEALREIYKNHGIFAILRDNQYLTEDKKPLQPQLNKKKNHYEQFSMQNVYLEELTPNTLGNAPVLSPKLNNSQAICPSEICPITTLPPQIIYFDSNTQQPLKGNINSLNNLRNGQKISYYPKNNVFDIMRCKLVNFLRTQPINCSDQAIWDEAMKIAHTQPELISKIRENDLMKWVFNFVEKHKQRVRSQIIQNTTNSSINSSQNSHMIYSEQKTKPAIDQKVQLNQIINRNMLQNEITSPIIDQKVHLNQIINRNMLQNEIASPIIDQKVHLNQISNRKQNNQFFTNNFSKSSIHKNNEIEHSSLKPSSKKSKKAD